MKSSQNAQLVIFILLTLLACSIQAGKVDSKWPSFDQQLKAIVPNDTLIAGDGVANDYFGLSVSVWGNRVLVGAEGNDEVANSAGAAYVFEFDDTSWVQTAKLTANDGAAYDYFGGSVSLWGNRAMVAARGNNQSAGSVYVFEFDGANWIQSDKLTANDAATQDNFGNSISLQGDRVLIGSPRDDDNAYNSGATYVFEYDGLTWNQSAKLPPDGAVFEELFGAAVSLKGNRALIGAYNGKNQNNMRSGIAYIFEFNGTNWIQTNKFEASDGVDTDYFGYAVSLSNNRALIGAHGDDGYIGAAYIYLYDGSSWGQETKLTGNDSELNDQFGLSVSMWGNRALIGAYRGDNQNNIESGAAYVFDYDGNYWNQTIKLSDSTGTVNDFFGTSVSLTSGWLLAGATGGAGSQGDVHVFLDDPIYHDGFE